MADELQRAIALIRAGDKPAGKSLLLQVLKREPRNEIAWLWMSSVVTTDAQRQDCLERALAIDPTNRMARKGLALLKSKQVGQPEPDETGRQAAVPRKIPSMTVDPSLLATTPLHVEAPAQDGADDVVVVHDQPDSSQDTPPVSHPPPEQFEQTPVPPAQKESTPAKAGRAEEPGRAKEPSRAKRLGLVLPVAAFVCVLVGIVIYLVLAPWLNSNKQMLTFQPDDSKQTSPSSFTPGDPTATPQGEDITDPNYIQGKAAYKAQDYQEVLRLMTLVLDKDPDLASAYRYRGMAYFYLNDYQAMFEEMERALAIDPEYALGYAGRGLAYSGLGDETRAVEDWRKALAIDPSLAMAHHNIGSNYFRQGDYVHAIEAYNLALDIDPNRAYTWCDRSQVLLNLQQYSDCVDSADKSIALDPDLWVSYYCRGTCRTALGQYDLAISDLDTYVAAVPDDPEGWYNRGYTYRRFDPDDNQQAIDDYTRAIELDPTFAWALINRAGVYIDLQAYELALADYDAALTLGEIPAAYMGRGDAYWGLGEYDKSVTALKKAIALFPGYAAAYGRLSRTYLDLGEYQNAITAADQLLALDSSSDDALLTLRVRGRAYYGLGDYEQAIADLTQVIDERPTLTTYYYRGIAYQANGQDGEAVMDLGLFVRLGGADNPDLAEDANKRLAELQ